MMKKQGKPNRRDFLARSGMASLGAFTGPAFPSVASCGGSHDGSGLRELPGGEGGFSSYHFNVPRHPRVEEYATIEAITDGVPVWSFSNLCYIYGVSPDLMPGLVMQQGNSHPAAKIRPKKSWEIKYNLCGTESELTRRTAYNDSQPMLPVHLIDGDPNTAWASFEMEAPGSHPEWIRIDLPMESEVASVVLLTADYANPRLWKLREGAAEGTCSPD